MHKYKIELLNEMTWTYMLWVFYWVNFRFVAIHDLNSVIFTEGSSISNKISRNMKIYLHMYALLDNLYQMQLKERNRDSECVSEGGRGSF